METSDKMIQLMEALVKVIGRAAVPVEEVQKIVATGKKQVRAFNLCDGNSQQTAIAKKVGLRQADLSKTSKRWVQKGVVFWLGEGKEKRLLHIYPIPESAKKPRKKLRKKKRK